MRINYTIDLKDEHDNILWPEVECVVETTVTFKPNDPIVVIDAISIVGFNEKTNEKAEIDLRSSSLPLWRILEGYLADILSKDDDFYNCALESEGISYRGRGPNDPDGCYVQEVA